MATNLDGNYQLAIISELRHLETELVTPLVDGRTIIEVFLTLQNQGSLCLVRGQVDIVLGRLNNRIHLSGTGFRMKPPIIVNDHGDVSIFQSVEDVERYLESPDVLENRYSAYDSEGRLLVLKAPKPQTGKFFGIQSISVDKVAISSDESQPQHSEALKEVLRDLLIQFHVPSTWIEKATLSDLLTKSIEQVGFTK